GFTVLISLAAIWCWRMAASKDRSALLVALVLIACFVEPYILLQRWWFHFAKPSSYFTQVSAPSQFLQKYAPEENRIYTSVTPGYSFDLPRTEPHNITARRGFHNAAGYEPLMLARYDKAFGNGGGFSTPNFNAPPDRQILNPSWQVLDLLNVRFMVEFSAGPSKFVDKRGIDASATDAGIEVKPGAKAVLNGTPEQIDSLTVVSLLTNSGDLSDSQTIAWFNIHATDGRIITRDLQAGRDTAEWAHERADVKPTIRHRLAEVFDERPGDDRNSFPAYRYWTRFGLGEKLKVDRIEIVNVSGNASLLISKVTAHDSAGSNSFLLTPALPEHWRKVYDQDSVQIYENPRRLPRAWLVPNARVVSEEEALRLIRGEGDQPFDPRQIALIEREPSFDQAMPDGKFDQGEANIVNNEPNRLAVETGADASTALVVSEINYPGWEATIDGEPTTIFKTNYLLRGVIVPAGSHRVEMRYTAPAARIGGVVSILTLLLLAGLAVKARRR
ncbi:MAG: YfhO family protein, partial [Acidobacteriota bacterium]|nr:YfhO family protein [Acidobacteriota bacterium]